VVTAFIKQPGQRDVFFFDEGRFGLKTETGKRWGKRGQILHTEVSQSYQNFYAYSAVSPFSGNSFSLFLPWVNTEIMNSVFGRNGSGLSRYRTADYLGWCRLAPQ
jgi:hypothetical protein